MTSGDLKTLEAPGRRLNYPEIGVVVDANRDSDGTHYP